MFIPGKDVSKKVTLSPVKRFIDTVFVPVCVFIISLGSFSEAFILVEDLRNMLKSKFSNEFEYETLADLHVGNTNSYVDDLLGAPAAAKPLGEDIDVKYYINDKFLVTSYFKGERLTAYTVVAIADGFSPSLEWYDGLTLGDKPLAEFNEQPQAFTFDNASTNRFFIELSPSELSGYFQNSYFGTLQYGTGDVNQELLNELYNSEVFGTEEETFEKIKAFRQVSHPNFYGQGELDINTIQKGLLSNGEFMNFFLR